MSANSGAAIRFIQREPVDRAAVLSAVKEVKSDCQRADQILQDIRALFGKGDQGLERIDVNETALAGLWTLRGSFNEHGVSVRSELHPDVPPIAGHRGQLQEVIINLLQNAVEAMISDRTAIHSRSAPSWWPFCSDESPRVYGHCRFASHTSHR